MREGGAWLVRGRWHQQWAWARAWRASVVGMGRCNSRRRVVARCEGEGVVGGFIGICHFGRRGRMLGALRVVR